MSNVRGVLAAVLVLVLSGCHGVAPTTLVPKVRTAEAKLVSNAGANEVAAPEAAAQEVQDPATIQVAALAQDFRYLNQALWNGVPAQRAGYVRLENLTVSASQPYSVTIRTQD